MPKRMTFKDKIKTRSGKCFDGDLIYVTVKDSAGRPAHVHGRRIAAHRLTQHNTAFGEKMRMIANLFRRMPSDFVDDLKGYAHLYNLQHRSRQKPISAFNIFVAVLGRHNTLTYSVISLSQTFGNSVGEWIEGGALRNVNTEKLFNAEII